MIKRHKKLFLILMLLTAVCNIVGVLAYTLTKSSTLLYILDVAVLVGLLVLNNVYRNNISSKALKKKIDKNTFYLLRETSSVIWIGVYVHIFLSITLAIYLYVAA